MADKTFSYDGRTISVRPPRIADADTIGWLINKLPAERRTVRMANFFEFAAIADIEGDPLFPALSQNSTLEEIDEAYKEYAKLPRAFIDWWPGAVAEVEGSQKKALSKK